MPKENGVYPYLDVAAPNAATKVVLITAMVALRNDDPPPALDLKKTGDGWILAAEAAGRKVQVKITAKDVYPEVSVRM